MNRAAWVSHLDGMVAISEGRAAITGIREVAMWDPKTSIARDLTRAHRSTESPIALTEFRHTGDVSTSTTRPQLRTPLFKMSSFISRWCLQFSPCLIPINYSHPVALCVRDYRFYSSNRLPSFADLTLPFLFVFKSASSIWKSFEFRSVVECCRRLSSEESEVVFSESLVPEENLYYDGMTELP